MSVEYQIDNERGRITIQITGKVTIADILEGAKRMLTDPLLRPGLKGYWDFTAAELLESDLPDLSKLAEFEREHAEQIGSGRRAVVVGGFKQLMAFRFFEALRGGRKESKVFMDAEKADAWLER